MRTSDEPRDERTVGRISQEEGNKYIKLPHWISVSRSAEGEEYLVHRAKTSEIGRLSVSFFRPEARRGKDGKSMSQCIGCGLALHNQ